LGEDIAREQEKEKDLIKDDEVFLMKENSKRIREQKKQPLTIIIGNPPYSIGQKSANDNAQNQYYPKLEKRIENTYLKETSATLSRGVYDTYIKAIRWSTDRLGNNGIIGFITNNGWLDKGTFDGFCKNLDYIMKIIKLNLQ
jgi:predicted helicase